MLERVNNVKVFRSFYTLRYDRCSESYVRRADAVQFNRPIFEEASWTEKQCFLRALWRAVIYFDMLAVFGSGHTKEEHMTWKELARVGPRRL